MPLLLSLLQAWIAVTAGLLAIGHYSDSWMDDTAKHTFVENVRSRMGPNRAEWLRGISAAFISFFDSIYGSRGSRSDRLFWIATFFLYLSFVQARFTLIVVGLPVPPPTAMLVTAMGVTIATMCWVYAFFESGDLFRLYRTGISPLLAASGWRLAGLVLIGAFGAGLYVLLVGLIVKALHGSASAVIGVAIGGAFALPTVSLCCAIPERFYPVGPLRSLASSAIFIMVLAALVPSAAAAFARDFDKTGWPILSFIVFNLFGDAISLVETRWLLVLSRSAGATLWLLLALVADLLLSAAVFLVLPVVVGENIHTFFQGVLFRGEQPWMGLLFWSTFATSFVFYLFLITALCWRALVTVWPVFRWVSTLFDFPAHPIRAFVMGMTVLETAIFAGFALSRFL